MAFALDTVVPWGRSCAEYLSMFDLALADLEKTILGCGDGPASFNAEMYRRGRRVVSVDPIYRFSAPEIAGRIAQTSDVVLRQLRANQESYVWDCISSPEELAALRMSAMQSFLADYPAGQRDGRYLPGALPALPFADREFDLALCSHLLFLYSDQLSNTFHRAAIAELLLFLPGSPGAEIHSCVAPAEDEPVIRKHYPNSFRDTYLLTYLKNRGITDLTVAGMMTHMCVDTTVRAAFDLGLSCTIAHDACATRDLSFGGRRVAAAEVQAAYVAALDGLFARALTVEEIVAGI